MQPPSDKLEAIVDAARILAATETRWALIGGVAVALHSGIARATLDVDVAVDSRTNLEELGTAFLAAGFTIRGRFQHSLNLRHPDGDPVQIAFDRTFDEAIERSETFDVHGVEIRVVTRADLVVLKERSGNDPSRRRSKALRDLADAALLREGPSDPDEGW